MDSATGHEWTPVYRPHAQLGGRGRRIPAKVAILTLAVLALAVLEASTSPPVVAQAPSPPSTEVAPPVAPGPPVQAAPTPGQEPAAPGTTVHGAGPPAEPARPEIRVSSPLASPQDTRPYNTTGPALSIGFGHSYAGAYGLQFAVPIAFGDAAIQLAPYVSVGAIPGKQEADTGAAGAAGLFGSIGTKNRLVIELGYGPLATRELPLHGYVVVVEPLYGLVVGAGYEFLSPVGLFFRACLGAGFVLEGEQDIDAAFSLGAGWKPW